MSTLPSANQLRTIDDLDTPAVVIDLTIVERNLRRWQDYCNQHGLANRPHIKTHKLVEFAQWQQTLGANGITCQKLGEAEAMADQGLDDILITYNIIGTRKLERLRALHARADVKVGCDSAYVMEGLEAGMAGAGRRLPVVIECDTGALRCGVTDPATAIDFAKRLDRSSSLSFGGLFTYPPKKDNGAAQAFLSEVVGELEKAGIATPIVSNGGTPDMWRAHETPIATEHRAGTYIYNDRMQVSLGAATYDDCALTVLATVVSRGAEDRGCIDAGSKSLTSDLAGQIGHGLIVDYPDAAIQGLSEEHGHLDLSKTTRKPAVGERVRIIPNHACPISNLVDQVYAIRGTQVEKILTVDARGKLT